MDILIYQLHGAEPVKQKTLIAATSAYPSAGEALTATIVMPDGWHYRPLNSGYAVYFSDEDHCTSLDVILAVIATEPKPITDPSLVYSI